MDKLLKHALDDDAVGFINRFKDKMSTHLGDAREQITREVVADMTGTEVQEKDDIDSKLLKAAEKLPKDKKKKFMDLMSKGDKAAAMELLREAKKLSESYIKNVLKKGDKSVKAKNVSSKGSDKWDDDDWETALDKSYSSGLNDPNAKAKPASKNPLDIAYADGQQDGANE